MRNPFKLLAHSPQYIFGRFETVRALYSHGQRIRQLVSTARPALRIGERYGESSTPLPLATSGCVISAESVAFHARALSRKAFSEGVSLSAQASSALLASAKALPLHGAYGPSVTYASLATSPKLRADQPILSVNESARLDLVRAIAGDTFLIEVVNAYLGYAPKLVSSWLFWSLHNELTRDEREARYQTVRFHYDVHGLNFLYVNFYITEVDSDSGAHVLIEGSHRGKRMKQLFGSARLEDGQAFEQYGQERIKTMEGPAGTGFFEDTSCYHKALAPKSRDRLMLQLRYQ